MHSESRDRFYNRVAKAGFIGFVATFGSLMVVPLLPLDRNIGMVAVGVGVLAWVISALVMIGAIAARDIPKWKKNRWRFSISSLLPLMLGVALVLASITAAARAVSAIRLVIALCGIMVASFVVNFIYIFWSRIRHFKSMNAQERFLTWSKVAERLSNGEGTLVVGKCYQVPTVWWSERKIFTLDEARSSIEVDVIITICPQRKRISDWLRSTYPAVPVIELDSGNLHS